MLEFTAPEPIAAASRSKPMYSGLITMPTILKVSVQRVSYIASLPPGEVRVSVSPILKLDGEESFTSTAHSLFFSGSLPSSSSGLFK